MLKRALLMAAAVLFVTAAPARAQYVTPGITQDRPAAPGAPVGLTACCFPSGTPVAFFVGGIPVGTAPATIPVAPPPVQGPVKAGEPVQFAASGEFTVPASVTTGQDIGAAAVVGGEVVTHSAPAVVAAEQPTEPTTPTPTTPTETVAVAAEAVAAGAGGLPVTGSSNPFPLAVLAGGLVAVGGLSLVASKRRRDTSGQR